MGIIEEDMNDFMSIVAEGSDAFSNIDGASSDSLLEGLNPEQRSAVCHLDGPLLILAGAGSGKTRVITYRIAYMMRKHHVRAGSILAITFTNKAAGELKERIEALVGDDSRYIWSGTFHSIFARILRRHAQLIGYEKTFSIIDTDDQIKLIKQSMTALDIPEKLYKPRNFQYEISSSKNAMISPDDYEKLAGQDDYKRKCAKIYKRYCAMLKENNAMDFDDILINMVKLLNDHPDVRELYQEKFKYIMVDEYQDTNMAQYKAIKLLADKYRNLCVVGDDDQSIYSFRGADVRLILNFEKDYADAKVIKLEENYRSTKVILDAANAVIANNKSRKKKNLRTSGADGDKIIIMNADNQSVEAGFVADTIKKLVTNGKFKYSDVAILYRMNALSRSLESSLRQREIPFKIFGGLRFYDRKEIKDVLAYLRLIADSHDNLAFDRIINVPKRGIGDATVDQVRILSATTGKNCLDICACANTYSELSRASGRLMSFAALIGEFRECIDRNEMTFQEFVELVENKSGIIDEIIAQRENKGELTDRVENLKELLSEAVEFEKNIRSEALNNKADDQEPTYDEDTILEIQDDPMLEDEIKDADSLRGILRSYLENAALYSEGDKVEDGDDFVKLMSIHSAKGLEFGVVFLIGAEEGIFPSYKCIGTQSELEEERRLMYVAVTRAKKNLVVLLTKTRMLFGQTSANAPSRFLKEIPDELVFKMGASRETPKNDKPVMTKAREEASKRISSALSSDFVKGNQTTSKAVHERKSGCLLPAEVFVGMKVTHDRFGDGVITKSEQVAGDALVVVDFDGMKKNMLVGSAGLKRING